MTLQELRNILGDRFTVIVESIGPLMRLTITCVDPVLVNEYNVQPVSCNYLSHSDEAEDMEADVANEIVKYGLLSLMNLPPFYKPKN